MFGILYFLVFIVFHSTHAQQLCNPDHVGNVTLDLNYTLYWEASTNCESTSYIIYIRVGDQLNHIYTTENIYLDVSFLPACEFFQFEVIAHSDNQVSDPVLLNDYIPAPSGADLTISSFNVRINPGSLYLEWEVTEKFAHCARGFRIVIRDEWYVPRDLYTQETNITIDNLVPCGDYEFGVMAIYNIQSEGPITSIRYRYPATKLPLPILESVNATQNSAVLRWSVSMYSANRCPITSFVIDGSPYFNQTSAIQDSPARPPININVPYLRPDTMYFMRVYVVNSAGPSSPFQMAVQTLPASTN